MGRAPESGAAPGDAPLEATGETIGRLVTGYRAAKLLFTAARLDLFTFLAGDRAREPAGRVGEEVVGARQRGNHDRARRGAGARELARDLRLEPRAAEVFLDGLAACGFLIKEAGRYRNASVSSALLARGRPGFLGDNLRYQDFSWGAWGSLEEVLRRGRPRRPLDRLLRAEPGFTADYIRGMAGIAWGPAREVARALSPASGEMLDVGGGPGTYSMALLERNSGLRSTILDLPGTLAVSRACLNGTPAGRRLELRPGDYHRARLGRGRYGLILLSHVTHDESPGFNRELLRRCRQALRPGGRLAVHDFMTDEAGTRPLFAALFAAHMLVSTRAGSAYRAADYRAWLREAGLRPGRPRAIASRAVNSTVLLVGERP